MSNTLLPRLAARLHAPADPPDDALLGRYAADRSEEAFALLVARHGPMVFAVCRRVLGNVPDADDAFQAAFLVLVRRADEVRHTDRLAGWLYGVAYRTALEARSVRANRRKREANTAELPDMPHTPSSTDTELSAIVERELAALPDHYRLAVALCDLDGRSRTEAASLLGIPEGTLSSRLNAGRKRLAERLARWGYGPAAVVAVTPTVSATTIEATIRLASGVAPAHVQSLSEGVIRAMTAKRRLTGWVVAGLFVSAVVGTVAVAGGDGNDPAAKPVAKVPANVAKPPEGGDKKVSDALPVVVKAVPAAGDETVDPGLKEVSVTFSKEMNDKSWTWAQDLGRGAKLPSGENKPTFSKDKKTCTLAVKLEPETTYAVWINNENFANFKDADGNPSLPYLLVFRTGKAK